MEIIRDTFRINQLKEMAANTFGKLVKAVVDVEKELLALDAELHSDLEALLLDKGSKQKNLWGINLYPEMEQGDFVEFDSVINMRPSQGNRSRGIEDEELRKRIIEIVNKRIER